MLTESQQIEEIYAQYPRKIGKRAAIRAVENAVKRMVKDHPLNGSTVEWNPESARRFLWKRAAMYAQSPAGQKPQDPSQDFRPHPATWFNQDRFYDDPAEWQKPNGSRNGNHKAVTADSETIARANAKIIELGRNHLRAR